MQGVSPRFGALILATAEAAASISSFVAGNFATARFVNPARLGLANRRHADAREAKLIR
jgi:hypothetical protein